MENDVIKFKLFSVSFLYFLVNFVFSFANMCHKVSIMLAAMRVSFESVFSFGG